MQVAEQTTELVTINNLDEFGEWIKTANLETVKDFSILADAYKCIEIVIGEAGKIKITNQDTLNLANDYLQSIKKAHKLIEGAMDPRRKELYDTYKRHKELMNGYLEPLKDSEIDGKRKVALYLQDQERIRLEEEKKKKKEADAEAEREREQLLKEAEKAADDGDEGKFNELAAQAEEVNPQDHMPVTQPTRMPPPGMSTRENWQVVDIDLRRLIKAVHDGDPRVNIKCLVPNFSYLNQRARADKAAFNMPGVTVKDKGTVSIRTK